MIEDVLKRIYRVLPSNVGEPLKKIYADHANRRHIRGEVKVSTDQIRDLSRGFRGERILVDCGFNSGIVLEEMLAQLPSFKAYGFELNQQAFQAAATRLQENNSRILSLDFAAVTNYDGKTVFYEMGDREHICPVQGSSIIEGLDPARDRGDETEVDCVDLSSWLERAFDTHRNGYDPFIGIKMDIEGAEYDVLEKLISDGSIDLVSHLSIEFHARRFVGQDHVDILERENAIRAVLAEKSRSNGLQVREWF